MPFLSELYESPLFNVLANPVLRIGEDLQNICIKGQDRIRSSIRGGMTSIAFIGGMVVTYTIAPGIDNWFQDTWTTVGAPDYAVTILSAYSSGWLISYPTNWVTNLILRGITNCIYQEFRSYNLAKR